MGSCPGHNQHRPDKYRPDYKPVGYISGSGRSDQHQSFFRHIVWHFASGIRRRQPEPGLYDSEYDNHESESERNFEHDYDYAVAEFGYRHHVTSIGSGNFAQQHFPEFAGSGGPELHGYDWCSKLDWCFWRFGQSKQH